MTRPARLVALALSVAAVALVASTLRTFSHTVDEPAHIAAGMEWLERGRYEYEHQHPPLARVAVAIGPWLAGVRGHGLPSMWQEGPAILRESGDYVGTLALARAGTLAFLVVACWAAWLLARRIAGPAAGAVAVGLVVLCPPVLAHAGLATTDLAIAACFPLALVALLAWIERPDPRRAALLGLACALAVLVKFSAGPYIAVTFPLVVAAWLVARRRLPVESRPPLPTPRRALAHAGIAAGAGALAVWGAYRFSVGAVGGITLPAPEFWLGLGDVARHNGEGHPSFLLGEYGSDGWWYYFPVALAVKTPLPWLVAALAGVLACAREARRDWRLVAPLAGAAVVLLFGMTAHINIGVRHVLPLYPLLAVAAAVAIVDVWRTGVPARAVAGVLGAWLLASVARAHPDHLAWFNELAGAHPERIMVDSNLDWGQDMLRVARELEARKIDAVATACFGCQSLAYLSGARVYPLQPGMRAAGWVVASETQLNGSYVQPHDGYWWLYDHEPVARIGRSVRLYHIGPAR